ADEPERMAQARGGRAAGLRPELGGERVTEAGSRAQGEQGHQGLGVTAADPDRDVAGEDLDAPEEANRERASCAHQTPPRETAAPGIPPRGRAPPPIGPLVPPGPNAPYPRDGQP